MKLRLVGGLCLLVLLLATACHPGKHARHTPDKRKQQGQAHRGYAQQHNTQATTNQRGKLPAKPVVPNATPPPVHTSAQVGKVISTAKAYLNTPYQWGGTTHKGIDCSGLMLVSFKAAGLQLPRTADQQALRGKPVSKRELRPGDVLFFDTIRPGKVGHAGLVVAGQGEKAIFIHAASHGGVRLDALATAYYTKYFISARRLLE